ncbi:MAG TPA: ester cyclase [Thermoleophilaceae bacterium]|nr:ester cyclase [Thermoleophilaceae bacterium]
MAETETTTDAPDPTEAKPQRRRITRRKAVETHVRSYFDAIASRDPDAMAAHWREDGVADIVPLRPLRGTGELVAFFRELFAAVPDLETTVTRVVAGETQAAIEWRMTGHFTGAPFQGLDPTDRRVDMRGLDLFEVEDGKITGSTGYYDGMSFARQVGLMPPEDSSAENAMKSAFNAATKVRRAVADWRSGR